MTLLATLALIIATAACGVEDQNLPKGARQTPGASPLASNRPTVAQMKGETCDGKSE